MTQVTIEIDDVQEFIMQKVSDGEIEDQEFAQSIFDDGLWNLYQRWKASQPGEQPDIDPDTETEE